MKYSVFSRLVLAGIVLLAIGSARAGISLNSTRVILQAPSQEASIVVRNQSSEAIMLQTWVEAGDVSKELNIPFVTTPPLSVLEGKKQQILRVLYQGQGLPDDRESLFWLNAQEIPQKAKSANSLQIAMRQRIKIFYRPDKLLGTVEGADALVKWKLELGGTRPGVKVVNNSEYNISFAEAKLVGRNGAEFLINADMVAPKSNSFFPLKNSSLKSLEATAELRVEYQKINDYGALELHRVNLINF